MSWADLIVAAVIGAAVGAVVTLLRALFDEGGASW